MKNTHKISQHLRFFGVENIHNVLRNILVYVRISAQYVFLVLDRHEAMTDLMNVMGRLVDSKGKILIPGISEQVLAVTKDEEKSYGPIDFDMVRSSSLRQCRFEIYCLNIWLL